jgi:HD-like signal output (HDOD) protein
MNSLIQLLNRFFYPQRGSLLACQEDSESAPAPLEPADDPADLQFLPLDLDHEFQPWLVNLATFEELPLNQSEQNFLNAFEQLIIGEKPTSHFVPRLPSVIPQLMRNLKDENMSSAQLARQIVKDPVLVGEAIRLANSPYYRRSHKIANLEQAVILLGRNGLNQLIARVAFYPILNLHSGHITKLAGPRIWSQSEKSAFICQCFAKREKADLFSAYLAGLVHHVGFLVGLRLMDQSLNATEKKIPRSDEFYRLFIAHSRRFSLRIVQEWGFPDSVITAIRENIENKFDRSMSLLGKILYISDQYSKVNVLIENNRMPPDLDLDLQMITNHPCYCALLLLPMTGI